jgi:hypothetical protein
MQVNDFSYNHYGSDVQDFSFILLVSEKKGEINICDLQNFSVIVY